MKAPRIVTLAARAFGWLGRKSVTFNLGDGFLRGVGDTVNIAGVAGLRGPAQDTNSIVAACLGYIVDTLPEARLRVKAQKGDEDETLATHPVLDLLRRPNPSAGYLWRDLLGALGASLAVDGNAYLRIRRNGFSQPSSLEFIPHDCCDPRERVYGGGLAYYAVNGNGKYEEVSPEEILHFRVGIDPNNTLRGWSRFKSVALSILTDNEAEVYNRVMLRNLGVIGWSISPEDPGDEIHEENAELIKEKFLQQFTGEERGKPYVSSRRLRITAVGHTPDKMVVRDMRTTPEERICAVFRIPPIVAGMGAGLARSTMANTKEQREQAVESCNCPMWALIADVMTARFLDLKFLKPGQFVEFDLGTVRSLQEDEDKRHERARKNYSEGIWKRSESRSYTGKTSEADDDVYATDLNLRQAQEALISQETQRSKDRAMLAKTLFGDE